MAFQVSFDNIGKLAGAPVLVRPFTVLAGPNNTGKSFFSKSLYSVFEAMHTNHVLMQIQGLAEPLQRGILEMKMAGGARTELDPIELNLNRLENLCGALSGKADEISAVKGIHADLVEIAEGVVCAYGRLRGKFEAVAKSEEQPFGDASLKMMDSGIQDLDKISKQKPEEIIISGFGEALRQNLIGNFQVPVLANLKKDAGQDAVLAIEDAVGNTVGRVTLKDNTLEFAIQSDGLRRLQKHSRVIYLESPIHWKLRGALNMVHRFPLPGVLRRTLLNVPKYFSDLDGELYADYSGEVAFPDLLRRLTEEVIRGKITLAESGKLVFHEFGGGTYDLSITSAGVVNLGILALLIERKIIDKGSFIFIDEPESNLHPQWHEAMISALFDLARGGAHVVIATHSVDILKWIEVHVKNNPDDKGFIALNQFSDSGVVNGDKGFSDKLNDIQRELTMPFHNLYIRGL